MNRFFLPIILGLFGYAAHAQLDVKPTTDTVNLIRVETGNIEHFIDVEVLRLDAATSNNQVRLAVATNRANPALFSLLSNPVTIGSGIKIVSLPITILKGKSTSDTIRADIEYGTGFGSRKPVVIIIKNPAAPSAQTNKSSPDTTDWAFSIVAGSNFDFFDPPTFKNFAGDLNLFVPNLIAVGKDDPLKLGFHFGVYNYRFFVADSSKGFIRSENILLNKQDQVIQTDITKFIRETYALDSKTNYNNWGIYFNPMIRIADSKFGRVYLNFHFEHLWRTEIRSFFKVVQRKDTLTLRQADVNAGIVLQNYENIRSLYEKSEYHDNYLGIGLPIKLEFKKFLNVSLTPTAGVALFEVTQYVITDKSGIRYKTGFNEVVRKGFFLGKFQLTTNVSPINITLGGEYRKIYQQRAFFGMYLGANVPIEKLVK